jgi:hypothetical protein
MESDFGEFKGSRIIPQNICDIEISSELSIAERQEQFLQKTGSSTVHKVGDGTVKCTYGEMNLRKMVADLVTR